jgi:hypothetical protein
VTERIEERPPRGSIQGPRTRWPAKVLIGRLVTDRMLAQLLVNARQAPREDGGGAEKNPTDSDDNGGNQYIAPKCPEVNLSEEHHLGVIRPRVRDDLKQLTAERFAFVRGDSRLSRLSRSHFSEHVECADPCDRVHALTSHEVRAAEHIVPAPVALSLGHPRKASPGCATARKEPRPLDFSAHERGVELEVPRSVVVDFVNPENANPRMHAHVVEGLGDKPWLDHECVLIEPENQTALGVINHELEASGEAMDDPIVSVRLRISQDMPSGFRASNRASYVPSVV